MEALGRLRDGDWDAALELTMVGASPRRRSPRPCCSAPARVCVGRGDPARPWPARRGCDRCGRWTAWSASARRPPRSTCTARGDVPAMLATFDRAVEVVGVAWSEAFQARIRLTALVLGHLADAAAEASARRPGGPGGDAPALLAGVDRVMQRVRRRKRPFGPEGVAWLERTHAEHLRLRWLADVDRAEAAELVGGVAAHRRRVRADGPVPVGAGDELHAAGNLVGRRHRNPCGRHVGGIEPPIGGVLMPGHEAGSCASLMKKLVFQHRISGPNRSSIASSILG